MALIERFYRKDSDAAKAMEIGADAVLVNTAIAVAGNPKLMAEAFKEAVIGLDPKKGTSIQFSEKRLQYIKMLKAGENWKGKGSQGTA